MIKNKEIIDLMGQYIYVTVTFVALLQFLYDMESFFGFMAITKDRFIVSFTLIYSHLSSTYISVFTDHKSYVIMLPIICHLPSLCSITFSRAF